MRVAAIFEKTTGANSILPAGAACVQGGVSVDGATWSANNSAYRVRRGIAQYAGFENGQTWTFNATVPEGVTCKVHMVGITWTGGLYQKYYGAFPQSGTAALPITFTVAGIPAADTTCALLVEFGYGDTWSDTTEITPEDISELSLMCGDGSTQKTTEVCALRPDEISENAILAKAKNSKLNINLTIYPTMEAWGFCERSITYATVYDLDLPENRMIFYGRVTGVKSSLTDKYAQEVTLASAQDFLEDTPLIQMPYQSDYKINEWLSRQITSHNDSVESARQITLNSTVDENIYIGTPNKLYGSMFEGISQAATGEKLYLNQLYKSVFGETELEFSERYEDRLVYLDVAEHLGTDSDTAIVIGENLREIAIEKSIDGGIYSGVKVISGVNSTGYRGYRIAYDAQMVSLHGEGRIKTIVADNICFKGPATVYDPETGTTTTTEEYTTYQDNLERFARKEAAKLSDPPIKITLAAEDLAAMGYTGYEPFELYNSYPVVCPKIGLYGEKLRITAIRRRICDGRIENMTIERGQRLANTPSSAPASTQAARTQTDTTRIISDSTEKTVEITQNAIADTNDGMKFRIIHEPWGETGHHDENTMYIVHNEGKTDVYIGDDHITSEGGGGTIENAVILTGEQESEWALDHQMVDVDFRGGCSMWYAGIPSRIVVQGLRVLVQVDEEDIVPDDLMTELTLEDHLGVSLTYKCVITSLTASAGYAKIKYYRSGQYIGETSAYSIGKGAGFTEKTFGMVLLFGGWTLYGNDLFPILDMAFCYIIDGTPHRTSAFGLPGNYLTNPMICSAAERGFGTTLLQRTEPSS